MLDISCNVYHVQSGYHGIHVGKHLNLDKDFLEDIIFYLPLQVVIKSKLCILKVFGRWRVSLIKEAFIHNTCQTNRHITSSCHQRKGIVSP